VHVLLATDADWIVDEVTAALGGPDTSFTVCREGRMVAALVADRDPDLVIADLQIGSMGGMAVCMALRLDESAGALEHVPVIMLLDRVADVYLAKRSEAEGWLVKPLDALRLRRAVDAVMDGGSWTEGVPDVNDAASDDAASDAVNGERADDEAVTPDGETVDAG